MAFGYSYHNANVGSPGARDKGCCSVNCLKFSLYIFNLIFLLAGLAILGIGLWTLLDKHRYVSLLLTSGLYDASAHVLVGSGLFVVAAAVVGCCGISRESRCCVLAYAMLLCLVFLVQACAGVLAYTYREQVHGRLAKQLNSTFVEQYGVEYDTTVTDAVDEMQRTMKCCGAESYEDWRLSLWWKSDTRGSRKTPDSCCKTESFNCAIRDHPSNIQHTGCVYKLADIIRDHLVILGAVALSVCTIQFFGIGLSIALYVRLRDFYPGGL